jgi:twinkle protein
MGIQLKVHQPCSCGSSDGRTYYDWGWLCYVCNESHSEAQQGHGKVNMSNVSQIQDKERVASLRPPGDDAVAKSIPDRGITRATCEAYGVVTDGNDYWFPYTDSDDSVTAYKKRGVNEKKFSTTGDWKGARLFGQSIFSKGSSRYLTIVEGELDCLAAYQMMGSKYAVVSVRNGAAAAITDAQNHYEWIDSFENIVVCMDNDPPGKAAANQLAELFGAKVKMFKAPDGMKDACDFLSQQKEKKFLEHWWAAERFVPDGIVDGASLWDEVSKPVERSLVNYPFSGINKLTYGIRDSELVTITAGSGLGKSQFVKELVYHVLNNTEDNIGLLFLEESTKKTARSLMSLHANKPLHLPDVVCDPELLRESFDATLGTGRLFLFDHFGSTNIDNIISRVKFMAKALKTQYVFLDHVSIVVSAQGEGDERKAIDQIMTRLRMLCQETGICLFVVSHLKRPDGKGHEEGTATSLSQLRGSGSIAQLSDIVIGLERNGQDPDPLERHTTHVRILKNRFSGLTGPAGRLLYDLEYGRMVQRNDEEEL